MSSSERRHFCKSYFSFSLGTWVSFLISFIQAPVITRLINPEKFGKGSCFQILLDLLFTLCLFGTQNAFMRFYYSTDGRKSHELLWSAISLSLVLASIVSVFLLLLSKKINLFVTGKSEGNISTILIIGIFTYIFQNYNENILRFENKGKYYSFIQISKSFSSFVIIVILALLGIRSYQALIFGVIGSVCIGILVGIPFRFNYWTKPKIDSMLPINIMNYSSPLVVSSLAYQALVFTDRFMLRLFTDFEAVGLYSAG